MLTGICFFSLGEFFYDFLSNIFLSLQLVLSSLLSILIILSRIFQWLRISEYFEAVIFLDLTFSLVDVLVSFIISSIPENHPSIVFILLSVLLLLFSFLGFLSPRFPLCFLYCFLDHLQVLNCFIHFIYQLDCIFHFI